MSEMGSDIRADLHAYHDGELHGLARWRFERRLRRDSALRQELAGLERLGGWLREYEGAAPEPDLWDRIEQRLPGLDAQRKEAAEQGAGGLGWWLRPVGAVAAAAAAAVAIWLGAFQSSPPRGGVVQWMDTGGRSVMVLEEDSESGVTIIWTLDNAVDGAARGGGRDVV